MSNPRIKLVSPVAGDFQPGLAEHGFAGPPYSLLVLGALTPAGYDLQLIDESVRAVDHNRIDDADLVAITVMTPAAKRSYEIADIYRARGIPVIMGGIHPTCLPEEVAPHADSVVVGEAEDLWAGILDDWHNGRLAKQYKADELPDLSRQPIPRHDLLKGAGKYSLPHAVMATRGCPNNCEFCTVTQFYGRKYRTRRLEDVMEEVGSFKGKFIYFYDDNIVGKPKYALELFKAMIPLRKWWGSHSTIRIAREDELVESAARSGCKLLIIGFETVNTESLPALGKPPVKPDEYIRAIDKMHKWGIGVQGDFILGLDTDDSSVFEKTVEFIKKSGIDLIYLNLPYPYPRTRMRDRIEKDGRLLIKDDWPKYMMGNVCVRPKNMTP